MNELGLVLLGGVLTLTGTLLNERFKQINASRAAALLLIRELEFHQQRLTMAAWLDQHEQAAYNLRFPSPVWEAQSAALLAGAPPQEAEAILNWYASMAVLGFTLARQVDSDGRQSITGPERTRLQAALADAHGSARRLAVRWRLRRSIQLSPSLFEEVYQTSNQPR